MAYDIELMSLGVDLYSLLESAASTLNCVQHEFRFRSTSRQQRSDGLMFVRERYLTAQVWDFLRGHRAQFGGNRRYVIAFVNAPLESETSRNLFGSHEAAEGLAVVTLHNSSSYVKEQRRYCAYYLTRYALSFVNPGIRSHDDERRITCYFHKKTFKPEIRASMDSGDICDEDRRRLEKPLPEDNVRRPSADELHALVRMRAVVSGDHPHTVLMKGGGVKGLAFAGALAELEKYYWFDRHVGTSAGAIAALLLSAGYSPAELGTVLTKKRFRDFCDAPLWQLPFNLLLRSGLYPGDAVATWLRTLIAAKLPSQGPITLWEIERRTEAKTLMYASLAGKGTLVFSSDGQRGGTDATFAVRCSMSIPFFFWPQWVDGKRAYDGGLRNNFPLARFLRDHPHDLFIGLYLTSGNKRWRWPGSELLDIVLEGDERALVDENPARVVCIDTSPIGTVDFNIGPLEKDFLVKAGRAAALRFLCDRQFDNGPSEENLLEAESEAEAARNTVRRLRWKRRAIRCLILSGIAAIAYAGHILVPILSP